MAPKTQRVEGDKKSHFKCRVDRVLRQAMKPRRSWMLNKTTKLAGSAYLEEICKHILTLVTSQQVLDGSGEITSTMITKSIQDNDELRQVFKDYMFMPTIATGEQK